MSATNDRSITLGGVITMAAIIRVTMSVILTVPITLLLALGVALAEGGDYLVGALRIDPWEVANSKDYKVWLQANEKPQALGGMTTSWLGVDLAQYVPGQLYSAHFTQVGLYTDRDNLLWFVYAEPGVECLEGFSQFGTCLNNRPCGCTGDPNQFVSMGTFHAMELVTYGEGFWIARVYDAGGQATDVAKIFDPGTRIYDASVTTEERYTGTTDPFLTARFYYWHPRYQAPDGPFAEWPTSSADKVSSIFAADWNGVNSFCPQHYGAVPNVNGDERAWFAGTDGQVCSWLLFPSNHLNLPIILNSGDPGSGGI
jgi:hypothetical protein